MELKSLDSLQFSLYTYDLSYLPQVNLVLTNFLKMSALHTQRFARQQFHNLLQMKMPLLRILPS